MAREYPPVYRCTHGEALRYGEEGLHIDSFMENVRCARAIEQVIRDGVHETDETLSGDCALPVLEEFGFKRTMLVLANSIRRSGCPDLLRDETRAWGGSVFVPEDGKYNRCFTVDTAAVPLDTFVDQVRRAYRALGLFGPEHCVQDGQDYEGKVLVLSPDTLREGCWTPQNQLWYARGGFGCDPKSLGRAVYAVCLGDGEEARWNRADFAGVLDERFLPDWARERLEEIRGSRQERDSSPKMNL